MSTRGYITIIDDKKHVVAACYSGSDSYLDGLGLDVLDAYENHSMEDFIDSVREQKIDRRYLNVA